MSCYGRREFTGYCTAYVRTKDRVEHDFVTLCSGGLKREGEPVHTLLSCKDRAWDTFNKSLLEYIEQYPGHVHWRALPELLEETFIDIMKIQVTLYAVRARLCVGDFLPEDLYKDTPGYDQVKEKLS